MQIKQHDLTRAFKNGHPIALRKIHLYLNSIYYLLMYNHEEKVSLSDREIAAFKSIENAWMEHEKSLILNRYDCFKKVNRIEDVEVMLKVHPAYHHPLFDFLKQEANRRDIQHLIWNDSILNIEFFDYLALAIVGVSDRIRLEILNNLWDEAGRGSIENFHTTLFERLMNHCGLLYNRDRVIAQMSWEGLAGLNVFSHLALYSHHKMKYFGLLAATEMLDPPHYVQLLRGITHATAKVALDFELYQKQTTLNGEHAKRWLRNVVLPELMRCPDNTIDFWMGFYLRLDSAERYYDNMLQFLLTQKAA